MIPTLFGEPTPKFLRHLTAVFHGIEIGVAAFVALEFSGEVCGHWLCFVIVQCG